jgi:pyruvate/2-oxoglutarate dehydrogenase complex dihydrolipoamide acyltransferase (E2) component
MHEPKGRYLPLAGPRRFIGDLVHFAHRIPSAPVSRTIDLSALIEPRVRHPSRPSWASVFMKAYALVGHEHPPLRRSLLEFPWPRLYEHPWMNCALAIERTYHGEEGVFVGLFRAPERQSLAQLQKAVNWYKNETLEKVGFYRMALRFSQAPTPIRRLLWWGTLNISGYKRCKRFGTFGLSSYGSLGAEQLHPISPLTTTLTYGPIDPTTHRVVVKLIYDHRVLDGSFIARRLRDIEDTLNGPILEELRGGAVATTDRSVESPPMVEPLLRPHLPTSGIDREGSLNDRVPGSIIAPS